MQSQCKHPERVLIGHPFNPPHIIPLVEVVGGTKTSPEVIQRAIAFYASIGKKPVLLNKELPGHVGNRLQTALYKEVMYLIQQGVLQEAGDRSVDELAQEENELLVGLIRLRAQQGRARGVEEHA